MAEGIAPWICTARVAHRRLFPVENSFAYRVFYLVLPLSQPEGVRLPWPLSFRQSDHGARDGSSPLIWIRDILAQHGMTAEGEVLLVAMPRIFGYGFNPVSFWLCLDAEQRLRAVLYEVNNTFGETHCYLCLPEEGGIIHSGDWLSAEKLFHVSPFLPREGCYRFRFDFKPGERLGVWIDYAPADGRRQLLTSMTGTLQPMTRSRLRATWLRHPLLTWKIIALIHYQALRLFLKGAAYLPLPPQRTVRLSRGGRMNKM